MGNSPSNVEEQPRTRSRQSELSSIRDFMAQETFQHETTYSSDWFQPQQRDTSLIGEEFQFLPSRINVYGNSPSNVEEQLIGEEFQFLPSNINVYGNSPSNVEEQLIGEEFQFLPSNINVYGNISIQQTVSNDEHVLMGTQHMTRHHDTLTNDTFQHKTTCPSYWFQPEPSYSNDTFWPLPRDTSLIVEEFQFFASLANVYARDPDYWNVADQPTFYYGMNEWMSRLPGDKSLASVAIPGTHDSMARESELFNLGPGFARCQSLSLTQQLSMGIRFFDIRCRHFGNGLPIHHGKVYQHCNFTDGVRSMVDYLRQHDTEVIIMRVKEEYEAEYNNNSFSDAVDEVIAGFNGFFWKENKIPKLSDVRGKIVILQDFDSKEPFGIRYGDLIIADGYKKNHDEKWEEIKNNLEKGTERLKLTFSSAVGSWQASLPSQFARSMNPVLHSYVATHQSGPCFGIIAMDYPGSKIVVDIVKQNYC